MIVRTKSRRVKTFALAIALIVTTVTFTVIAFAANAGGGKYVSSGSQDSFSFDMPVTTTGTLYMRALSYKDTGGAVTWNLYVNGKFMVSGMTDTNAGGTPIYNFPAVKGTYTVTYSGLSNYTPIDIAAAISY